MSFRQLEAQLANARILPALSRLLMPEQPLFLVGGSLRDWLLDRPVNDYDFATPSDPTALAQSFARTVGGHWFYLDAARRQSRIVAGSLTYDFAPFRAADLLGDLRLRDFTINAMAIPISSAGEIGALIDPLGGRSDLENGVLRACSAGVLADDPLRVLKGVRHAAMLGFAPEPETFARMRHAVELFARVAGERVRSELAAIFTASHPRAIAMIDELGLWHRLLGIPGGSLALAEAFLRRMEAVLTVMADDPDIAPLLAEELEAGVSRAVLLRLAAFFRGYRPVALPARLAALHFGRKAAAILLALQSLPPAHLQDAATLPAYARARALWAARLGNHPVDLLLFLPCLADQSPSVVWQVLRPILRDYRRELVAGRVPDLLDGGWLRQNLGVGEGREAGALLAALRREEIAGRVCDAAQAAAFLRAQRQENRQENG